MKTKTTTLGSTTITRTQPKPSAKKSSLAKAQGVITVTVTNGRKKTPGAGVVLTNADMFKTEFKFADKKGVCKFTNLPEGRYSVVAIDSRIGEGMGAALDYVLVTSDQQNYDVALSFGRTGGIGNINVSSTMGGTPVQGAMVHVKSLDPQIQYDETRLTELPDGIAGFDPPDGTYKITVILPPYAPQQRVVEVGSSLNTIVFEF